MMITTTATPVTFARADQPLIQNLGVEAVYFGRTVATLVSEGIRLDAGEAYEFPKLLSDSGGSTIYIVTASGTADVRILLIG